MNRCIGIGNPLRGDDAAGLLVAAELRGQGLAEPELIELEGEPVDLIEAWRGAERVFVADAVRSGAGPGTVHRIDAAAGPLPAALAGPSTHALGLAEAIELGRALGRLPPRIVVFGIEGAEFGAGAAPTRAVRSAAVEVATAILAEWESPHRGQ